MDLIQMLTSQLGVNDNQAQGGAGLLFKLAKDKLGSGDFEKIADVIPGIDGMIDSAPEAGGLASALGGLAGAFGGDAGKLGDLASLAGGFKALDLDSDLIGKFIPVVVSYIQENGDDIVKGILERVLK